MGNGRSHWIISVGYLLAEMIADRYRLDAFSYVDDAGDLQRDPAMTPERIRNSFGCHYGCGIFELTKV